MRAKGKGKETTVSKRIPDERQEEATTEEAKEGRPREDWVVDKETLGEAIREIELATLNIKYKTSST